MLHWGSRYPSFKSPCDYETVLDSALFTFKSEGDAKVRALTSFNISVRLLPVTKYEIIFFEKILDGFYNRSCSTMPDYMLNIKYRCTRDKILTIGFTLFTSTLAFEIDSWDNVSCAHDANLFIHWLININAFLHKRSPVAFYFSE